MGKILVTLVFSYGNIESFFHSPEPGNVFQSPEPRKLYFWVLVKIIGFYINIFLQ
jgi:hypothetical protein